MACEFAQLVRMAYNSYYFCSKAQAPCGHMRWCPTETCVKHTDEYLSCSVRQEGLTSNKIEKEVKETAETIETKSEIEAVAMEVEEDVEVAKPSVLTIDSIEEEAKPLEEPQKAVAQTSFKTKNKNKNKRR